MVGKESMTSKWHKIRTAELFADGYVFGVIPPEWGCQPLGKNLEKTNSAKQKLSYERSQVP